MNCTIQKNPVSTLQFKIKAYYEDGFGHFIIHGKDLGEAFKTFYKAEAKLFRYVIGFKLSPQQPK